MKDSATKRKTDRRAQMSPDLIFELLLSIVRFSLAVRTLPGDGNRVLG